MPTGVNLGQAAAGIKLLPAVKEVHLHRDFPGRINIKIVERKPVALLPARYGFIAVDEDGVYLRKAGIGEEGLPVMTGLTFGRIISWRLATSQRCHGHLWSIRNGDNESLNRQNRRSEEIAQLAKGRLREKIPEPTRALNGKMDLRHARMLQMVLEHLVFLNEAEIDRLIEEKCKPYQQEIELLDTIPGVDKVLSASNLCRSRPCL